MTPVRSDLGQNFSTTIYLLFSHNYIALAYFTGLIIGIFLAIYKPSRFATFVLLGFAILLFSFEYDKHVIEAFREQTIKSLITTQQHFKLQRLIDITISELLPIFFYIAGWAFLFIAIVVEGIKVGKKKN